MIEIGPSLGTEKPTPTFFGQMRAYEARIKKLPFMLFTKTDSTVLAKKVEIKMFFTTMEISYLKLSVERGEIFIQAGRRD